VRFGQTHVASLPQPKGSHALGDGAFDASPMGIVLLKSLCLLVLSCLLQGFMLGLPIHRHLSGHLFGTGTV
jgi:hypothetical protein